MGVSLSNNNVPRYERDNQASHNITLFKFFLYGMGFFKLNPEPVSVPRVEIPYDITQVISQYNPAESYLSANPPFTTAYNAYVAIPAAQQQGSAEIASTEYSQESQESPQESQESQAPPESQDMPELIDNPDTKQNKISGIRNKL